MPLLVDILSVIAPVFLIAAAGYAWVRAKRPFDGVFATELVSDVAMPCLIFATLTKLQFSAAALAEITMATLLCFAAFAALGSAALRLAGLPLRPYLPSLLFPNTGNMGLPVCLFAFGEHGLGLAIVYLTVATVIQFTAGIAISMGSFSLARLARLPLLYGIAAALAFILGGWQVPRWLANTAGLLGSLAVPLMLFALGVALGQFRLAALRRTLGLGGLRLAMGGAVGWAVGLALGLDAAAQGVLIIQSAMPVGVFNYLLAQKYDVRPGEVASMVLASTALSFITLPLLLALVI